MFPCIIHAVYQVGPTVYVVQGISNVSVCYSYRIPVIFPRANAAACQPFWSSVVFAMEKCIRVIFPTAHQSESHKFPVRTSQRPHISSVCQ